ncbi:MAG TPA: sulfatase [Bacteroidales bacterium]|nr:sulfatase-like hydrolase/transferase [Bacteroidales bacterium]HNR41264.1 sulfatase [Bacteroidales bacterium]HPM17352.1 sulfatase [Bacteroidales bacterium]
MKINLKPALGIGVIASVPLVSCQNSGKQETSKPNILMILLDDYGYSDVGCYGSKFYETPNIDRLASQGIMFTDAYASCPVSSPTRGSILTGKYPVNTGITEWIPGRQATDYGAPYDKLLPLPFKLFLDPEEVTVAEMLKTKGYTTMISGKWHLGEDPAYWPENQGFDVNKGGYKAGQPFVTATANGYFSPYGNPRLDNGPPGEYLTDRQTDEAIRFIENNREKPFFVLLSYYAVHTPLQAKEQHIKKFTEKADSMGLSSISPFTRDKDWIKPSMPDDFRERIIQSNPVYAAMIWSVDENIGRVLARLEELGIDGNTVVIVTSDNGGLATSIGSPTCNAPLRAGKGWLYEGGIRVPLIVRYPGLKSPAKVVDYPVSSVDFYPTFAEIAGYDCSNEKIDGISFLSSLSGRNPEDRPLFWHYPHYNNRGVEPGSAIRLGKYKLIDNFERERQELYDLENDISETTDISASNPEKTRELFTLLNDWRALTGAKMMLPNPAWKKE